VSLQISDLWPSKRQPAEPVARARLQALRLKLPGLKRAQQLAAVRLQLLSFYPTGHFAFAWREFAPGDVSVWAWALESTEDTPRRQGHQWPETLLETDGNGLHLLQRQPGFEGQHWADGQLQSSQWWPHLPSEAEWARFARATGHDADEQPRPTPRQRTQQAMPPRQWLRGDNLPKPDPWQGWRWQAALLVLGIAISAALGVHLQTRSQLQHDKQLLAELRKQRETALSQRAKYEQLREDHEALLSLAPKLTQLELLDRVIGSGVLAVPVTQAGLMSQAAATPAAPGPGNVITAPAPGVVPPEVPTPVLAEWDFRNAQLKMTLDIPEGDIAMLDTTRRIEQLANISGLKIGLESSNNSLTLSMQVDDAKPAKSGGATPSSKP